MSKTIIYDFRKMEGDFMSLSREEWKKEFGSANSVTDLCNVLDQTSKPILNTVSSEIIGGFFTFGASWLDTIGRAVSNTWHGRNRYRCLRVLWDEMTEKADEILKDKEVEKELTDNCLQNRQLVRDCLRLTLALCCRTHVDVEANYARVRHGTVQNDKSSRSRWNQTNRDFALSWLKGEEFELTSDAGIEKFSWFGLLRNKLPALRGKMSPITSCNDGQVIMSLINEQVKMLRQT